VARSLTEAVVFTAQNAASSAAEVFKMNLDIPYNGTWYSQSWVTQRRPDPDLPTCKNTGYDCLGEIAGIIDVCYRHPATPSAVWSSNICPLIVPTAEEACLKMLCLAGVAGY
jgi:hypothetical protein